MWHFGFEVECQIKFVKHTHCQQLLLRITSKAPGSVVHGISVLSNHLHFLNESFSQLHFRSMVNMQTSDFTKLIYATSHVQCFTLNIMSSKVRRQETTLNLPISECGKLVRVGNW